MSLLEISIIKSSSITSSDTGGAKPVSRFTIDNTSSSPMLPALWAILAALLGIVVNKLSRGGFLYRAVYKQFQFTGCKRRPLLVGGQRLRDDHGDAILRRGDLGKVHAQVFIG